MSTALRHIDAALTRAKQRVSHLNAVRDMVLSCTKVVCGCAKFHEIRTLRYIQTHWYVRPHGCASGDYYNPGEGRWDCPSCGRVNRLYDRPEVEKLKYLFFDVLECYCDQDRSVCSDPRPCRACRAAGRTRDGRA